MACLLTQGYTLGCRDSIGGIQKAWIGNFSSGATFTLNPNDEITAFTGTTASYFKFEQEMETGEFNQTGAYSTENGTVFFDQQLTLMFHKNDANLRNQLLVLSPFKEKNQNQHTELLQQRLDSQQLDNCYPYIYPKKKPSRLTGWFSFFI